MVQARDAKTLEPLGLYYLIFHSVKASKSYQDLVRRLHRLSRAKSRRKLAARGDEESEVNAGLKDFTLLLPSDNCFMRRLSEPVNAAVGQLLEHGVPPGLIEYKDKLGRLVLVNILHGHADQDDLAYMLKEDYKRRNVRWKLETGPGTTGIVRICGDRTTFTKEDTAASILYRNAPKYPTPSRFIVVFEDKTEARTFVRQWHRRQISPLRGQDTSGQDAPMIDAELIW